jgi:hypothetical protein
MCAREWYVCKGVVYVPKSAICVQGCVYMWLGALSRECVRGAWVICVQGCG